MRLRLSYMTRYALGLLALAVRIGHAEAAPAPRVLALAPDDVRGLQVFAPAAGFPAVSADGKTLAELFLDGEDFSAAPVTTLVLWSTATGAVTASFSLGGASNVRADAKTVLAHANARLAKSAWRAATIYPPSDPDPERGIAQTVHAVGVTFAYDPVHDEVRFGKKHASFPPRDRIVPVEHGCFAIPHGIDRAFGAGKLVVLVPSEGTLGGDSCAALPRVDVALAVVVP